jgi:hypothetical protein
MVKIGKISKEEPRSGSGEGVEQRGRIESGPLPASKYIHRLAEGDLEQRMQAAYYLFSEGTGRISSWLGNVCKDSEFRSLLVLEQPRRAQGKGSASPRLTVGVAVLPETFEKIRAANRSPVLASAPSDQDALEFELEFEVDSLPAPRLDILTTKALGENGAIARFLKKFGEDIQQVEIDVTSVDRATEILRTRFQVQPIYPVARPGANGTRVNFFLVPTANGKKVLVELVEQPKVTS